MMNGWTHWHLFPSISRNSQDKNDTAFPRSDTFDLGAFASPGLSFLFIVILNSNLSRRPKELRRHLVVLVLWTEIQHRWLVCLTDCKLSPRVRFWSLSTYLSSLSFSWVRNESIIRGRLLYATRASILFSEVKSLTNTLTDIRASVIRHTQIVALSDACPLTSQNLRRRIVKTTNVEETNAMGFYADLGIRSVSLIETLTDRRCWVMDRDSLHEGLDRQMILFRCTILCRGRSISTLQLTIQKKLDMTSCNAS